MKITGEEILSYSTTEDQILIKIKRKEDVSNEVTIPFKMSNSSDKEVKKGIVVCSNSEHQNWVGKECIIPIEGTISLDTFIEIDDASEYEYRFVKVKNIFLVKE